MKSRISTKLIRVFKDTALNVPLLENIEVYYTPDRKYKMIVSQNKPGNKMITVSYKQCRELPDIEKCYELIKLLGIETAEPFSDEIAAELDKIQIFNKNIRRFEVK